VAWVVHGDGHTLPVREHQEQPVERDHGVPDVVQLERHPPPADVHEAPRGDVEVTVDAGWRVGPLLPPVEGHGAADREQALVVVEQLADGCVGLDRHEARAAEAVARRAGEGLVGVLVVTVPLRAAIVQRASSSVHRGEHDLDRRRTHPGSVRVRVRIPGYVPGPAGPTGFRTAIRGAPDGTRPGAL
jgi:hypothetical protein